jgi:hypothetical protein
MVRVRIRNRVEAEAEGWGLKTARNHLLRRYNTSDGGCSPTIVPSRHPVCLCVFLLFCACDCRVIVFTCLFVLIVSRVFVFFSCFVRAIVVSLSHVSCFVRAIVVSLSSRVLFCACDCRVIVFTSVRSSVLFSYPAVFAKGTTCCQEN